MNTSNPLRVLVVDDHRDFADSMVTMLRIWGHDARAAHGAVEGVSMAVLFQPQIILLDLAMPTIDGFAVARYLRQAGLKDAMLIAVSGFYDAAYQAKAIEAGFCCLLPKPVDFRRLGSLLSESVYDPSLPVSSADQSKQHASVSAN